MNAKGRADRRARSVRLVLEPVDPKTGVRREGSVLVYTWPSHAYRSRFRRFVSANNHNQVLRCAEGGNRYACGLWVGDEWYRKSAEMNADGRDVVHRGDRVERVTERQVFAVECGGTSENGA